MPSAWRGTAGMRPVMPSPVDSGTFAVWVSPFWSGQDEGSRTLLSVYGPGTRAEAWRASRWTVTAGGGQLQFSVFPADGSPATAISAPIGDWKPGDWHHVAAVWDALNTDHASLTLYIDGSSEAEATGLDLAVDRSRSDA